MPKLVRSPFREDKKPTCSFYYSKSGRLYLHDFGTSQHIDCIEAVKLKFNLSYQDAISKILEDKEKFTEGEQVIREPSKIEFIPGDYGTFNYFHKFHISNPTLLKYNVYPAKVIYSNEEIIARSNKSNPIFVYCSSNGNLKTYRPLSKDSLKKWGGNCNARDVWGLDQLPKKGQILFITSSLKDVMMLYELGYNAIAFNGEGYGVGDGDSAKVVREVINKLEKRFAYILFYMDNDAAGLKFGVKLSEQYRKKYITNLPNTPKDISDYSLKKGFYNARRNIKRLLREVFRIKSGYLEFIQSSGLAKMDSSSPINWDELDIR